MKKIVTSFIGMREYVWGLNKWSKEQGYNLGGIFFQWPIFQIFWSNNWLCDQTINVNLILNVFPDRCWEGINLFYGFVCGFLVKTYRGTHFLQSFFQIFFNVQSINKMPLTYQIFCLQYAERSAILLLKILLTGVQNFYINLLKNLL